MKEKEVLSSKEQFEEMLENENDELTDEERLEYQIEKDD